jgi:predicted transcriptional regulator
MANKVHENGWYIWSSHGTVLFYVALNPGCTIAEIAEGLYLTQRTIWGVVGDLRRAGMLDIIREGRRHRYSVKLDATFRHPTIESVPLRTLFGRLPEVGNATAA